MQKNKEKKFVLTVNRCGLEYNNKKFHFEQPKEIMSGLLPYANHLTKKVSMFIQKVLVVDVLC